MAAEENYQQVVCSFVAVIWAAWHLPINLAGYNDAVHSVANALILFPLFAFGLSINFAWLAQRNQSIWGAALAHGANNTIAAGMLLKPQS